MKTFFSTVALTLAVLAAPAAAQRQAQAAFSLDATGDLEIAADGSVHAYKLDKDQKPTIQEALDKSIRSWRFTPITVEGRPVIASTRMRLVLDALPIGDGNYRLQVKNVWFGEPGRSRSRMSPPRYPRDAAGVGLGARVVLVLKLDGQGNVERLHAEQVSLDVRAPNETIAENWRRKFEKSSVDAAKRWKFDLTEVVDGVPVETSVRVPVDYVMGRGNSDNRWRAYIPGPWRPVPWVGSGAVASQDATGLGEGDVQPLDSRFKLTTNLVGTML